MTNRRQGSQVKRVRTRRRRSSRRRLRSSRKRLRSSRKRTKHRKSYHNQQRGGLPEVGELPEVGGLPEVGEPLPIRYIEQSNALVVGDYQTPREIDKEAHTKAYTDTLRSMIDALEDDTSLRYELYLSIGCKCHVEDYKENCMKTQTEALPGFHIDDGATRCRFLIDADITDDDVQPTDYETHLFPMYWLDDYPPMVDILRVFMERNAAHGGKVVCINFAKFLHQEDPTYPHLVDLFYPKTRSSKWTGDHYYQTIKERRAVYLDWTYEPLGKDVHDYSYATFVLPGSQLKVGWRLIKGNSAKEAKWLKKLMKVSSISALEASRHPSVGIYIDSDGLLFDI